MRSDFVKVQLSAAGKKVAPVRVIGGRQDFLFEEDTVHEVTRAFDYERVLAPHRCGEEPMFELVTAKAKK
jgi:hypothetical protein